MVRLGAFARSDQGRMYAAVCDRWGIDPGAGFSDDFVAHNLRAALMVTAAPDLASPELDETDASWAAAGAANEREWLGGAR